MADESPSDLLLRLGRCVSTLKFVYHLLLKFTELCVSRDNFQLMSVLDSDEEETDT